jgi:thiol-disulfide isomerase/thioredoxin
MLIVFFPFQHEPIKRFLLLVMLACLVYSTTEIQGSDLGSKSQIIGVVRFNEHESIAGKLTGFHTGETLLWACPDFLEPLYININNIQQLTNRSEKYKTFRHQPGAIRVDMVDGEVVFGKLVRTEANSLMIESISLGTIEIPSARWRQYSTVEATGSVDSRPVTRILDEMADNTQLPMGWEFVRDGFSTIQRAATLRKDFNLEGRFRVDVRVAWTGKPSFDIAMGIDPNEPSASTAVHLEVWDGILVLAKQEDGKADTAAVRNLTPMDSRIELVILHDSSTGVTIAQDTQGVELARIELPSSRSRQCSGIQIVNHGESLRIESLRASRWPEEDLSTIEPRQGEPPEVVRNETLSSVSSEFKSNNSRPITEMVSIETIDGSRLTGNFQTDNSADSSVSFLVNRIAQPIQLKVEDIFRIYKTNFSGERKGSLRLSTDHVLLDVNCEPFRRSQDRELVKVRSAYFERPATLVAGANGDLRDLSLESKLEQSRLKSTGKPTSVRRSSALDNEATDFRIPSAIVLRTGETLHGDVESINEDELRFSSKITDGSLLKRGELRSIFLHPRLHPLPLDANKMGRLLTIPRNQSDNAPENVLILTSGDYMRGTVSRLSDKTLDFSVKDKTLRIPRRSVSAIVWPREAPNDIDDPPQTSGDEILINNQVAVEFIADKSSDAGLMILAIDVVENNVMTGRSPLLGEVSFSVKDITAISFGTTSLKNQKQSKNPWLFNLAKAPTTWEQNSDGSEANSNGGDSSPLIGLQAPPFRLVDLVGESIRLDQYRGKVVVLDFWASWCGPCMESLPEVYRIADSFGDRCQWLGINLQESQEQASKIANRLGIESSILLDSDGKVASLYDASAIPLVIVIAPDGIVQRVFMGMQRSRLESLRSAIGASVAQ